VREAQATRSGDPIRQPPRLLDETISPVPCASPNGRYVPAGSNHHHRTNTQSDMVSNTRSRPPRDVAQTEAEAKAQEAAAFVLSARLRPATKEKPRGRK
jgi:hypothetical protein